MLTKISISKIVKGHWRSLRTATGTRVHLPDVALFYGVPLALAVILVVLDVRLSSTDALLNVAGILFGFLSAIYFFVLERFQSSTPQEQSATRKRYLDEVRHNVGYGTIILMVIMVLLVLPLVGVGLVSQGREEIPLLEVSRWLTGPVLALCLHFVLTMLMIIKRVHSDA